MIPARWLVVALSIGVFFDVATPRSAEACGPVPCTQAKLTGAGGVPVNFPGVLWRPLIDSADPDRSPDPTQVALTRAGDPDTRLAFTATRTGARDFLLVPDSPLTVGETYVVSDPTVCAASGSQAAHIQFAVGAAAAMPTTLGTLAASAPQVGQRAVPGASSPCDVGVTAAWQTVQLTLAPEAVPWKSLLQLEVSVDDQPFTPSRYEDHSADTQVTIYHTCAGADPAADSGVASGSHVVRMRGTIAGTAIMVASSSATIQLDCAAADSGSGDGVGSGGPGAGGGGCNTSGGSAWLGLALGALLVRRARR